MARYIDADKFAQRIKLSPAFKNMAFEGDLLQRVVLDLLDNASAADVVEAKHGEWIVDDNITECSNCHKEYVAARGMLQLKEFYYCPNCGAKMDGRS